MTLIGEIFSATMINEDVVEQGNRAKSSRASKQNQMIRMVKHMVMKRHS